MAGFAHICVVLVSGSRLLCLVVHISSKGTKADNTEGQQGKKMKGNQTRYRNFVCGCRSKSHGARCLVFLSCFFTVVFPSCSAFLCWRLFASVPHSGCGRTARLAAPAQHPTLCTHTYQRARLRDCRGAAPPSIDRATSINSKLLLRVWGLFCIISTWN